MNHYSKAKFSIKTIATFSSAIADVAEEYYQRELQKPNYIVNKEFAGNKVIITSKTGIKYTPNMSKLKELEKKSEKKVEDDIKRYKNKMKLRKEGIK